MNFNILFDYPVWMILLCLLCGLFYSGVLYYGNNKAGFSIPLKRTLAAIRFLAISIIALLLLAPLVESRTQHVEEPLLIFLQDNSGSLLFAEDSSYYQDDYMPGVKEFLEAMGPDHETRLYTFGENFTQADSFDLSERVTDMAKVFRELDVRYSNRNIGAVVLSGDGLYNRGINPLYAAANVNYPVYTIALGDTMPRRDVILKRVNHNEITYLGNRFPVEIEVEALQSEGFTSRLTVSLDGEEVFRENITFSSDHHIETISFHLEADDAGMQQYLASLSPLEDEVSLDNNQKEFFIDVIDGRQQVLILANSPHPDVGAVKQALVNNDHYEADVFMIKDFDGSIEAYDLVILHQLPSDQHPELAILEQTTEASASLLFIMGSQTNLPAFNRLAGILEIQPRTDELTETLPEYNPGFVLFSLQESTRRLFDNLPPLYSPFGIYTLSGGAHVLLNQKIGNVVTEDPLVMFSEIGDRRAGVIAGEGIWRWRQHAFMRQANHLAFDEMISRMVHYLALQEDRSLFRVQSDNLVYENEPVLFEAELYNPSYELINDPEVQLLITNQEETELPYVMGRTANAYRLNAGTFNPGTYHWEASVNVGGERFTDEGIFNVSALDLEGLRTIADHRLLYQLAVSSGARMFYPGQWNELITDIRARDDINPKMYSHRDFVEVINIKALFFIILLLISLEWFVRKRSGSY